jgi:two-component system NtrC family sensor kinase
MPDDRIRRVAALCADVAAILAGDRQRRLPADGDGELAPLLEAMNRIIDTLAAKERLLGDNIQSLQAVNRDLREAQENLLLSEKLASLGRVSAGIAHEIGNPIGAILGYLDLLKRRADLDDDLRDSLSRIEAEARRIDETIRDLLDFARPSTATLVPVDVNDVVRTTFDELGRQPAFRTVRLQYELADALPAIAANRARLRRVLVNLLANAADASPPGATILVATRLVDSAAAVPPGFPPPPALRRETDPPEIDYSHLRLALTYDLTTDRPLSSERHWVEILVRDHGHGIPAEQLREIFDPFVTTKPPGKGTGLGLPISLSIIRSFNGRFQVASELSTGTTITVQIPVGGNRLL